MKNIQSGWFTTVLGIAIMIAACLDFFGVIEVPAPEGITKFYQISTAFVVGLVLFLMPKTYMEEVLKKVISKKTD